jgi:hypothetical protein
MTQRFHIAGLPEPVTLETYLKKIDESGTKLMRVGELIEELKKHDPRMPVLAHMFHEGWGLQVIAYSPIKEIYSDEMNVMIEYDFIRERQQGIDTDY